MRKRPTLTKRRLARELARRRQLSNLAAAAVIDQCVAIISEEIAAGGRVEIANFLVLEVQSRTRTLDLGRDDPVQQTFFVLKCRPSQHLHDLLRALVDR